MSSRVSFWLLIALIAGVGVGKAIQSDTLDWDLFWHLRVAEQLRADGIGPIVDRLSFSSIKTPWTPYSWLAELGMEQLWNRLGWRSAVAGEAVMVAGIIVMIALTCVARAGEDQRLKCVVGTAFGAFLTIPFISFRPVTFAILILAVIAFLLLRPRTWAVWLVVPLTALLANVHLCVVVAPIWVGCMLVGAIVEKKDAWTYAMLLAATVVASLMTPMLPGALRTAWFYQSGDVMVRSGVIAEMQPIGIPTAMLVIAFLAVAVAHRKQIRVAEWLMLAASGVLMVRLGKFAPIFALIAAPLLAVTLPAMKDAIFRKPAIAVGLAVVVLLIVGRSIVSFPRAGVTMDQWVNRRGPRVGCYPTAAAEFVEKNVTPRSGRLINEFNWGGYLAWRLGDKYQVFLDGRTQLFPSDFWQSTYLGSDEDAARAIAEANADVAIIPVRRPRFGKALSMLGWQSVYRDDFAEVHVPPQ